MALTHPLLWSVAVGLLLPLVLLPNAFAQSPCGPDQLTVSINEYPNIQGYVTLDYTTSISQYTSRVIFTSRNDLEITVQIDDTKKPPQFLQSLRIDQILNIIPHNVPANTGYDLQMLVGVDRDGDSFIPDDDVNSLQFRLLCVDPNYRTTTYYHVLKISIKDINDNPPQFQNVPYTATVNELTPVGMTLYSRVSSTDRDNQNNKLVGYSIATDSSSQFNGNGVFAIPERSKGVVTLASPLDFEFMMSRVNNPNLTSYTMTVTAKDYGDLNPRPYNYSQSSWTLLTISVVDGDDLGPYFVYDSCPRSPFKACVRPQYTASITTGTTTPSSSSSLAFVPVPRLTNPNQAVDMLMRDGDTLNAAVNCSISYTVPAGYHGYFTTSSQLVAGTDPHRYRCSIRVTTPFNRTIIQSLDVIVLATEQTPNAYSDEAVVTVTITPQNSYAPQLASSSGVFVGYIPETAVHKDTVKNATNLTGVLTLAVTDRDLSACDPTPSYNITLSPAAPFSVDPLGFIYLRQGSLKFETRQTYSFLVTVQELGGTPPSSSSVSLTVHVIKAALIG